MKPIGPLMWEHRLIEQIVPLLRKQLDRIEAEGCVDTAFIETAVDFFRTYADRLHHGKEEDILFAALEGRKLAPEHAAIMAELVHEHGVARTAVSELVAARQAYLEGDDSAAATIAARLRQLADLYPDHIEKEDRAFFRPAMEYLTEGEQQRMLEQFAEVDRHVVHEKYEDLLEGLGARVRRRPGPACRS